MSLDTEVPNFSAIPDNVSPLFTVYVVVFEAVGCCDFVDGALDELELHTFD